MKIDLSDKYISNYDRRVIESLLSRRNNLLNDDLKQMWYLIDLVWDDYGCDNKNIDINKVKKFYSHPVWLLNGLFIEQDTISMLHRHIVSDWVINNKLMKIMDYGGGFGTLSRLIGKKDRSINIDIYEPYPSEHSINKMKNYANINMVSKFSSNYDCLISMDVLEHVQNPLRYLHRMINNVKINGYVVIAAPFYPIIKCHLPENFHFRHTFNFFTKIMGLEFVGYLPKTPVRVYKRKHNVDVDWKKIRMLEALSSYSYYFFEVGKYILRPVWFKFKKDNEVF